MRQIALFFIIFVINPEDILGSGVGPFPNKIRFPFGGPFMGIELVVALPLHLDNYEVYMSFYFEANYNLPENQTEFEYPQIVAKSLNLNRTVVYQVLEHKLLSHGFPGKNCILRSICQTAEYTFENSHIIADLLHILLSPSTSQSEGLIDYENAEKYGKLHKHCKKYKKICPIDILSLISWIDIF